MKAAFPNRPLQRMPMLLGAAALFWAGGWAVDLAGDFFAPSPPQPARQQSQEVIVDSQRPEVRAHRDFLSGLQPRRDAAQSGEPHAEAELARYYETAFGPDRDFAQAMDLYRKAAAQGNSEAKYGLGRMYENGEGVPADPAAAQAWYGRALADWQVPAAAGDIVAQ